MQDTPIQWASKSWNPMRGCRRVSPGCEQCYAEDIAGRFSGLHPKTGTPMAYHGLARISSSGDARWTGAVSFVAEKLAEPIRMRAPKDGSRHRIFVNSMSDLFYEEFTNEQIAAVFGVMAACPQHDFLVLTKRPRRMREWFAWAAKRGDDGRAMFPDDEDSWRIGQMLAVTLRRLAGIDGQRPGTKATGWNDFDPRRQPWPLPNVWLGVSAEDQQRADERIPDLLSVPAAVRWVSAEPLLGPVRLDRPLLVCAHWHQRDDRGRAPWEPEDVSKVWWEPQALRGIGQRTVDWIVVGGESGDGAREFDLAWPRLIAAQCKAAHVPCFVKQLGARPFGGDPAFGGSGLLSLRDRKHGGDPSEWPADLRIREFPEPRNA